MQKETITELDAVTGETITRDMTSEEVAEIEIPHETTTSDS